MSASRHFNDFSCDAEFIFAAIRNDGDARNRFRIDGIRNLDAFNAMPHSY